MQPRTIALTATLLPCIGIVSSYLFSAASGHVPWCLPLLEGCTSISKAARKGDTIFLFRALMIPSAVVIMAYWVLAYRWLLALGDTDSKRPFTMMCIGVIGAAFLVLYVDFLGTTGEMYGFMRRFGVIIYFSFTGLAEMILVSRLYRLPGAISLGRIRTWMFLLCVLMIGIGILNVVVSLLPGELYETKNVIEWNFAVLMQLFFLLTAAGWKLSRFGTRYTVSQSIT